MSEATEMYVKSPEYWQPYILERQSGFSHIRSQPVIAPSNIISRLDASLGAQEVLIDEHNIYEDKVHKWYRVRWLREDGSSIEGWIANVNTLAITKVDPVHAATPTREFMHVTIIFKGETWQGLLEQVEDKTDDNS